MGILSAHKAQLSQVSSMPTLAASVKILFSGGKIVSRCFYWTHGKLLLATAFPSNC